jgi:hypothetical protein
MSLLARTLANNEKEAWDSLARTKGELFQQPEWIAALGASATRVGIFDPGGCIVGGFVVRQTSRAGMRISRNAPFCQSAGPFWEPRATSAIGRLEERRRLLEAMAEFLEPGRGACFVSVSRTAEDMLPFRWRGFRCVVEYTYRLPLLAHGDDFLSGYDGAVRNDIRKARKDGLQPDVGLDLEGLGILQRDALERRGASGAQTLSGVLRYAGASANAFTVVVRREGQTLAGCLVVGFGQSAYYVLGGHSRSGATGTHHGAGSLALHTAIVEATRRGFRVFDFEGSTIPRVEPFTRGFGGTLTPYYSVAKAWFPLECVLKLRYRSHF